MLVMNEVMFRVVKEFDVMKVNRTKAGQERVNRLTKENKCLACECSLLVDVKTVSGCCASCAQSQYYAIRRGKTTTVELIKHGERLPPQTPGRKPSSAYAARLLGREGSELDKGEPRA